MTLFEDQADNDFERAVALVEQTIASLGVDPTAARLASTDGTHRFSLRRGSAAMVVAVQPPAEGEADGTMRAIAPVVRLPAPERQLALFRRLLDSNAADLAGVAFGIAGDDVVLVAERSLRDLDASEVDGMIRSLGRDADRFDDLLAREFETTRSSDPKTS